MRTRRPLSTQTGQLLRSIAAPAPSSRPGPICCTIAPARCCCYSCRRCCCARRTARRLGSSPASGTQAGQHAMAAQVRQTTRLLGTALFARPLHRSPSAQVQTHPHADLHLAPSPLRAGRRSMEHPRRLLRLRLPGPQQGDRWGTQATCVRHGSNFRARLCRLCFSS